LKNLLGDKVFENPKDEEILKRLIEFSGTGKGDLVVDFFSGSGTTAHALMLAEAEKPLGRKFILVQLPEVIDPNTGSSEKVKKIARNAVAFLDSIKARHVICEIAKERIRRAGKKIAEELAAKNAEIAKKDGQGELSPDNPDNPVNPVEKEIPDIGFRVLKLDTSSLRDTSATVSETNQEFANFERIKSDRSPEDLLFQVLLETRIPLSEPIVKRKVAGNEVLFVGCDGEDDAATSGAPLAACLDAKAKMATEFFIEIAKLKPGIAFFRDDAFVDDSARANLQQVFNQFSPTTSIKVI
jgi:adenine-specific DNA-methyltransferase